MSYQKQLPEEKAEQQRIYQQFLRLAFADGTLEKRMPSERINSKGSRAHRLDKLTQQPDPLIPEPLDLSELDLQLLIQGQVVLFNQYQYKRHDALRLIEKLRLEQHRRMLEGLGFK